MRSGSMLSASRRAAWSRSSATSAFRSRSAFPMFGTVIQRFARVEPTVHRRIAPCGVGSGGRRFPASAFVWAASLGIARSALLPQSVGWVGGVVGLLLVVNAGGRLLGDSADFAAGGTVNTIAFVLFLFWVLVTSIFLAQRVPVARRAPEG